MRSMLAHILLMFTRMCLSNSRCITACFAKEGIIVFTVRLAVGAEASGYRSTICSSGTWGLCLLAMVRSIYGGLVLCIVSSDKREGIERPSSSGCKPIPKMCSKFSWMDMRGVSRRLTPTKLSTYLYGFTCRSPGWRPSGSRGTGVHAGYPFSSALYRVILANCALPVPPMAIPLICLYTGTPMVKISFFSTSNLQKLRTSSQVMFVKYFS